MINIANPAIKAMLDSQESSGPVYVAKPELGEETITTSSDVQVKPSTSVKDSYFIQLTLNGDTKAVGLKLPQGISPLGITQFKLQIFEAMRPYAPTNGKPIVKGARKVFAVPA